MGFIEKYRTVTRGIPAACFEIMSIKIIITVMAIMLKGFQVMRAACISTGSGPACLDFTEWQLDLLPVKIPTLLRYG